MTPLLRIAARNVFRQKRRSLFTALMMIGGFALSSLSIGISDGSYGYLIDLFTRNETGHVQIHRAGYLNRPSLYATIDDLDAYTAPILDADARIKAWAPRVESPALAFRDTRTSGAYLIGVDPVREPATTRLTERVTEGRFLRADDESATIPILLDRGLARILHAGVGDEIVLIGQGADGSIANDLFTVVGLVGTAGQTAIGLNGYVALADAQRFLALPGRVHEIAVVLQDHHQAEAVAASLDTQLGDAFDASPWQVVEEEFYRAMRADVEGMWVSLLIIILIVAIGVLNTVLMTILERTREFGVLRALGTRPRALFLMILLETAVLALLAMIPAMLLGAGLNHWFAVTGIMLPEPVDVGGLAFDRMYGVVNARSLWLPGVVVLTTAVLVSVLPALRAARIVPVDALRAT